MSHSFLRISCFGHSGLETRGPEDHLFSMFVTLVDQPHPTKTNVFRSQCSWRSGMIIGQPPLERPGCEM